jgi:hypothetical protein
VQQQRVAASAGALGSGSAADLAAAALDAGDLPGFSVNTEVATDYSDPASGDFMVLASYEADWVIDPATDSSVPDLFLALSLHDSAGDADALLTALAQSMGNNPDLTRMLDLGSVGLGDESMSASLTVQHAGEPALQLFAVAFRRGSVSVLIVGGGSLDQVAAYAQIVDQRLAAAGA